MVGLDKNKAFKAAAIAMGGGAAALAANFIINQPSPQPDLIKREKAATIEVMGRNRWGNVVGGTGFVISAQGDIVTVNHITRLRPY